METEKRLYAFMIYLLTKKYEEKELIRIIKGVYRSDVK